MGNRSFTGERKGRGCAPPAKEKLLSPWGARLIPRPFCASFSKVHGVFRALLKSAGLKPSGGRWPRIHELRHTFAVRALESSPAGRQRIGHHMLALAIYLGHVNINTTYRYLESSPELLRDIAVVAESFVQGGRA
jgi:integrase/recombinase XerD